MNVNKSILEGMILENAFNDIIYDNETTIFTEKGLFSFFKNIKIKKRKKDDDVLIPWDDGMEAAKAYSKELKQILQQDKYKEILSIANLNISYYITGTGMNFYIICRVDNCENISAKLAEELKKDLFNVIYSKYKIDSLGPLLLWDKQKSSFGLAIIDWIVLHDYMKKG